MSKRIYYGAAVQGAIEFGNRADINRLLVGTIKAEDFTVVSEHNVIGRSKEETRKILEGAIGPLPTSKKERHSHIRNKALELVEGDICAAIFEVSVPSHGVGVELTHAYLRPRRGLSRIPILALYENGYWPNDLSCMIGGIQEGEVPLFELYEYENLDDVTRYIKRFLQKV